MKFFRGPILSAVVSLVVGIYPAQSAGTTNSSPTAEAWAKCLLERAPKSTSNWLAMPEVSYVAGNVWDEKVQNLGIRLISSCYRVLIPTGKIDALQFQIGAIRNALKRTMPSVSDKEEAEIAASVCHTVLGDRVVRFAWFIGSGESKEQVIASSFVTSLADAETLDERIASSGVHTCFRIEKDGSLTDA